MQKYIFKSDRLGFREWQESDQDIFAEMNADLEVMEYFPKPLSTEESNRFIENITQMIRDFGYGLYAVDRLDNSEFIGYIGFWHLDLEGYANPSIEIGWRLHKNHWNQGFATEGALKCLDYGFKHLKFKQLYSLTSKTNLKSERIMQKIGMHKIDEFDHPEIKIESSLKRHILYTINNILHEQ